MKACKCGKPIPLNVVMCDKCGDAEALRNIEAFKAEVRRHCTPRYMQLAIEHMQAREIRDPYHLLIPKEPNTN